MMKIAVLDDYQQVALQFADWRAVRQRAEVVVFDHPFEDAAEVIRKMKGFTVICVMRERTPLTFDILSQLTGLQLIVSTGKRNASIDLEACQVFGVEVRYTDYHETGAPELTWALLLNLARQVNREAANLRNGGWQQTVGTDLSGKTIGIVGLGRVGSRIARYARAFDMRVLAWSQNLTEVQAKAAGAELVTKEQLFRESDFVTLHLVLSARSRHTVTARELSLMKPSAFFINTSRGSLVDELALLLALLENRIAGAALDVFELEPLPPEHPFRQLSNVLATPHVGYVTADTYRVFYEGTLRAVETWLKEQI